MRALKTGRLAVLCLLLAVTALLVHLPTGSGEVSAPKRALHEVFQGFGAWQSSAAFPMDATTVKALDLDDYLFQSYHQGQQAVTLYIGYYHSAKKVGAAHDPLVCFQGQGWQITRRDSGSYSLARQPGVKIAYSSMLVERQGERELILYWFQTNAKANATTYDQKLAMVLDRIAGKAEDNAFVRISAPVGTDTPEAVRQRILGFVENFYPDFLRYVTQG